MSLDTKNEVKRKLLQGKVCFGTWMQIGHPAVAEILSGANFDWIAIDMEHTDIGIKEFTDIARALNGRGPVPLARVRENDTMAIRQVLDAGAGGVIVPLINSAEEAVRAVRAAKFPPRGVRGTAFFRANRYGADFNEYMETSDRDNLVIVMIESKEAVASIDSIIAVDGVDGVFIGPYDLSLSYGTPGQLDAPAMIEARRKVLSACAKANKSAGIHEVRLTKQGIVNAVHDGFTFIALGMDTIFLETGARAALEMSCL